MNSEQLDARAVQQLVDGELAPESRRLLLAELAEHSPAWRQLALAFIECRIWDTEFRAVRDERDQAARPTPAHAPRRSRPFAVILAVSIVVSLSIGWSAGQMRPASDGAIPAHVARHDGATPDAGDAAVTDAAVTDAGTARDWPYGTVVPDEMRMDLYRAGYLLNESLTTVPVIMPDGVVVAIPVNQIDVRHLGHVAYQ